MRDKCAKLGVEFPEALCKINGAALGVVDFNHCVWWDEEKTDKIQTDHPTITEDDIKDWWQSGYVGFILENPRRLANPIPVIGRLFWGKDGYGKRKFLKANSQSLTRS